MTLIDWLLRDAPLATRREITPKLGFLLTVLLAIVWLIPFLWMGVATLRPASDGINVMAELIPSLKPTLDNVRDAWEIGDFPRTPSTPRSSAPASCWCSSSRSRWPALPLRGSNSPARR
ncbi:ABC-type glycerol-3-phosphate transport system permease component [Bradyrhizobium sp. I1.8.5]